MKRALLLNIAIFLSLYLCNTGRLLSEPLTDDKINVLIQDFKKDPRGPYQAIRWFCPDGSVNPAQQPCPAPGGFQHALPKDIVNSIEKENGVYLGQILAGMDPKDFFDESRQNSRLKQYQLEKYLQAIDDGWILRRARYYRGAVQAEDESSWGQEFLVWLLSGDRNIQNHFFLVRQTVKDIPRQAHSNQWQTIRALSKDISDLMPSFTDLRVKIHGQPEPEDLVRVREFYASHRDKITPELEMKFRSLEKELNEVFQPLQLDSLGKYMKRLPTSSEIYGLLGKVIKKHASVSGQTGNDALRFQSLCSDLAELLWKIRRDLLSVPSANMRLAAMDLSHEAENILFHSAQSWKPLTHGGLFEKAYVLAKAAASCGFLEMWEWEQVEPQLRPPVEDKISIREFRERAGSAQRVVEWGNGMTLTVYGPVINLFKGFEPKSSGFIDDLIRSSVLLPLGDVAGELGEASSILSGSSNDVMGLPDSSRVRGLNPGLALGELEVIVGRSEKLTFSLKKIYAVSHVPSELKPVAGIASVSEGNLVSHVQLLARNLGIPNSVITGQVLTELAPFSGQKVFYAVSPGGTVIMKPEAKMTSEEKKLAGGEKRKDERIIFPSDKLDLKRYELISLNRVRASDSGRLCGPKAANLGELKYLFPDKVVNGLIIPFGVFRAHLDQPMPGTNSSYWRFLRDTFASTDRTGKQKEGIAVNNEAPILARLAELRAAMKKIPFLPGFRDELGKRFQEELGAKPGEVPVFIRSDTNMEDLKEFTGAGLNLTVFNVVEEEKILQAIRDVWASPYTERSYLWRQKYLLNPQNVFPSILIIPTVNVEKSGVMITTGLITSDLDDITVVFNLGAAGAVEGQTAESYLLRSDGRNLFLSLSRELSFTTLPSTGGTQKTPTFLSAPILKPDEIQQLRELAGLIKNRLVKSKAKESPGPFDIELGFKENRIWLFQVRPYVENKKALASFYLKNLDPVIPADKSVSLSERIE